MGQVTIELYEYGLFINHNDGVTVLFPERNHVLTMTAGGETIPIVRGADMEMMGPGGAPVPASKPTQLAGYGRFVLDLKAAFGPAPIPVMPDLYDPAAPVDATVLNGRLSLKGGRIDGRACSYPGKQSTFTFPNGSFTVTDLVVFEMDIPTGEVAQLRVNGKFVDVADGATIEIRNGDGLGCPPQNFEALDELVELCRLGGYPNATAPTAVRSQIYAQGSTNICADAMITP